MTQPTVLVATRNPGKVREYRELLAAADCRLVSLDDMGVSEEVDETGDTFRENAALKATLYAAAAGVWALADDSGLEVDALGGEPGVRSARYGEPASNDGPTADGQAVAASQQMSDQDRVRLLLSNMAGIPWARRTARFRCVICIAGPMAAVSLELERGQAHLSSNARTSSRDDDRDLVFLEGGVAGMIQYQPRGEEGFGYDPVFFLPSYNLTMGQLSLAEKNRISHRADAARKAVPQLANLGVCH